jgi:tRNA-dihydrouridine synthase B
MNHGKHLEKPTIQEIHSTLMSHLDKLYSFYGNTSGVRIARKHIAWYFKHLGPVAQNVQSHINQAQCPSQQIVLINTAFDLLTTHSAG